MAELAGKRGLIVGIANAQSIAAGCAQACRAAGAELIVTYLNDKALPHVRPVAEAVGAAALLPFDVTEPAHESGLSAAIAGLGGRLDFAIHSVAFAPKADLQGPLLACSAEGFAQAMDVSCHSFVRLARLAQPFMGRGGSLLTMTYYGAEKVVDNYNLMGPVKAALEASVRYLAANLGPEGIRVNAISPGPIATRAASGIAYFDKLMDEARARAPAHRLVTIEEVGNLAAFLASDRATGITGGVHYVDAGYHAMA